MTKPKKPVIGVTCSNRGSWSSWIFNRFAIWRAGGVAVKSQPRSPADVDDLDGLVIGGGDDIVIVDRQTLEILSSIRLEGMIGGGHQIATDSKGNIYVAGSTRGMQKLTFKGVAHHDGKVALSPLSRLLSTSMPKRCLRINL